MDPSRAQPPLPEPALPRASPGHLAARLGLFDATMVVMGGIIGSGIFINPYVVARQVHSLSMILGVWLLGGLIALTGAFIWAELAARMPRVGGQYAYLRDGLHPLVGFLYGWALLLVINGGGAAAVAATFAKYFLELTHAPLSEVAVAIIALATLTLINCLGVRAGSTVQSTLMVLKILAIAALVGCGAWFIYATPGAARAAWHPVLDRPVSFDLLTAMGAALVPVLFAYGGWQTANFIAEEVREPTKNLPRGLLLGALGVVVLYLAANFIYARALGPEDLAATTTPASEVMRRALGPQGSALIAVAITISTLGFLSQSILTMPRVYFAMAEDRVFFRSLAWLHPRTRVPVVAIALEGAVAALIALSGRYEQILSYVVVMDWVFFGLSASCLFVFRKRERLSGATKPAYRVPGHPVTTALFVTIAALVVVNTVYKYPANAGVAMAVVAAGIPAYLIWRWRARKNAAAERL